MNIKVFICLVLVVVAVKALPVVNLGFKCDGSHVKLQYNGTSHGVLHVPCTLAQINGNPIGTAMDDPTPTEALVAIMKKTDLTQKAITVEILEL